ncbi:MAG TPA: Tex-like N-terminal domain-containing protein, partial [Atribacteraceae bacterium]|nr:Tex-like N-terminal domain-containing protein [Atribacteraceae bacterium]
LSMEKIHQELIAQKLALPSRQVAAVVDLLDEGSTVPFIARYRKEATGGCDEVMIAAIRDRIARLRELEKRREAILSGLEERGQLTDELKERILACMTLAALEDTYLPYRLKRRTRATVARERGLEALAEEILQQDGRNLFQAAQLFIDPEKGVETADDALAGARDIIAERINEDPAVRERMRSLYLHHALVRSRVIPGREEAGAKYRDYYQWEEPLASIPSHRMLAIRRGEKEDILSFSIEPPEGEALDILEEHMIVEEGEAAEQIRLAIRDGYRRLLGLAMETETRAWVKERADRQAIDVFAANLRELLLSPPLGRKRVLAIDPGFRTGCKMVVLSEQGSLLHHETLFFHQSVERDKSEGKKLMELCRVLAVQAIAIGNGTAGRETEDLLRRLDLPSSIPVIIVSESGASVYSASEVAREEFPDQDVTVRGAISIGRRLIDPLAELVKIDPKSIGVGQYQHDVDQTALKSALDDVVSHCVNLVGVEVNTASRELLAYVSGLGSRLA